MPNEIMPNEPMGGITSGLGEAQASSEALGGIASGIETLFQNIDKAENPEEIMNAIRGDEQSVEARRTELAQLVGEEDANKTPESVLTIVQPLMTVIESTGGIASLDVEPPIAENITPQQQEEALMRMARDEPTQMLAVGTNPEGNPTISGLQAIQNRVSTPLGLIDLARSLAPTAPKLSDFTKQYSDAPSVYDEYASFLPFQQLAKFGQIVGRSPTLLGAVLDPETTKLGDPLMKLAMLQAKEKQDLRTKALDKFVDAKKDAQSAQTKLFTSILPKLADRKVRFEKLDDGSVLQISPNNEVSVFRQGKEKPIIIGSTAIRYDKATDTYKPVYTAPGANTKSYSTPKGEFLIDFNQKDATTGAPKVFNLAGGLSEAEIKAQNFSFHSDGAGGGFGIDKRFPTKVDDTGATVPNFLFEVKGRDKTSVSTTDQGVYVINESNPEKSYLIPETAKQDIRIVGTEKTGFVSYNTQTGESKAIRGLKEPTTELMQNMELYHKAHTIVNNPDNYGNLIVQKARNDLNILSTKLLPPQSEFAKTVDKAAELFREQLTKSSGVDGTSIDIDNQVAMFKNNYYMDRLKKMTTTATQYDAQSGLKTVYSKMLGKLQEDTDKRVRDSLQLDRLGQLQKELATQIRGGSTAPFRLSVAKLLEDFGIKENVIDAIGISDAQYESFIGGSLEDLETAKKIGAQFAVEFASSFPGNLNQSEVDLIKEAGINLTTTKDGVDMMAQIFRDSAKRDQAEQKLINDYMADPQNNTKSPMAQYSEIQGKLIQYRESNPIVSQEMMQKIKGAGVDTNPRFLYKVEGSDQTGTNLNANQIERFKIVQNAKRAGANTADDFVEQMIIASSPIQMLAQKQLNNRDARFNKTQLKSIFNKYSPVIQIANPNYVEPEL